MAKKTKTAVCHGCCEEFTKKEYDWVRTKTFKWVSDEEDSSYYYVPMCKSCQNERSK